MGRTGAFIVIDSMLERIKHEKTVDIYGHVTCLRAQRNYMVQTEDQYIFIHDALLEAVTCGNTEVPARNLGAHIQKLSQPDPGETVTGMELEFKVCDLFHLWCLPLSFIIFIYCPFFYACMGHMESNEAEFLWLDAYPSCHKHMPVSKQAKYFFMV